MIKSVLIIGLCSILALETFLADVDLAGLSRFPELLSDFQEHRSQPPNLTFAVYQSFHDDSEQPATPSNDHQGLPFSKRQLHRVFLQILHAPVMINPENSFVVLTINESGTDCIVHTSDIAADVWQPPRA